MQAIIIDCESTDKQDREDRKNEVIELAYSVLHNGKVSTSFLSRYKPKHPITFGAMAAHHILPQDLADAPPSSTIDPKVIPGLYWIGHNVDFDWKLLGSPEVRRICTLALSRSYFPEQESHTLSAMTYFTQGATPAVRDKLRNAHSAQVDIDLCYDLTLFFADHLGIPVLDAEGLEQLWAASEHARVPQTMTFGKFRGEPISKVDRGYANWYRRQPDPDPYVLEAFRRNGLI